MLSTPVYIQILFIRSIGYLEGKAKVQMQSLREVSEGLNTHEKGLLL